MPLCLIHTADLHGRLQAHQARRLRELRQAREALLLDSGDALQAPNLFALPWLEPTTHLMNEAGYDAMALGNREYALTPSALAAKLGEFRFPVLSTNLRPQRETPPCLQRWAIVEAPDATRVGLFALSEPTLPPGSLWELVAAARYVPPEDVVDEALAALRDEADLLVALTHFGRRPEAELARAHPEIDLILAGHWHVNEPSLEVVGRTTIARTFHHGRGAAILTLAAAGWTQEAMEL